MPVMRTSSGTAYNVLISDLKYIVDARYKNTIGSSNIGSYNRYVLITGINKSVDTRTVFQMIVLTTGMKYTSIYVTVFQYNVLVSGIFL